MPQLTEYNRKRNFKITSEPKGKRERAVSGDYMIHLHDARRLHYDLRLGWKGVLKSWAVPKGPSLNPDEKRLAVMTEDHPMDYKNFEGVIPDKQYGAGPSLIWDAGRWRPLGDFEAGLKKGHVRIFINGIKLKGIWNIIKMRFGDSSKSQWLMVKEKDKYASETIHPDRWIESVATGSTLDELRASLKEHPEDAHILGEDLELGGDGSAEEDEEVAQKRRKKFSRKASAREPQKKSYLRKESEPKSSARIELVKEKFPEDLAPQLAVRVPKMPKSSHQQVERKFDGYRLLAYVKKGQVRLVTRNQNDWTNKLKSLAAGLTSFPDGVYDGEMVHLGDNGDTSFQKLQNALDVGSKELAFFVFDILHFDGFNTRRLPLAKRRELLEVAFKKAKPPKFVKISEILPEEGSFENACSSKWEGLIVKDTSAPYYETRHKSWVKVKCGNDEEFVIVGYTDPRGSRDYFGSLLLAEYVDGELHFRGKVGTGFDNDKLSILHKKMKVLAQKRPAKIKNLTIKKANWIKPELYAQIEFFEKTDTGSLRHPVYKGLRLDKTFTADPIEDSDEVDASEATAMQTSKSEAKEKPRIYLNKKASLSETEHEDEPVLTHPERVVFADVLPAKQDMANYFISIMPHFMDAAIGAPLSLVRCPQGAGSGQKCFFQKHIGDLKTMNLPQFPIQEREKIGDYTYIEKPSDVISLVQYGVLEFHAWNCRVPEIERPRYVVFDLDPDEGLDFSKVTEAAHFIRLILEELKYKSYARTTGGKGLHVVAPIEEQGWEEAEEFSRTVCMMAVQAQPSQFTATMSKAKRKGKIFLDYFRNQRGSTSIMSYSLRARPGALVATPLDWSEVNQKLDPKAFDIHTIPKRLQKLKKDPWAEFIRSIDT